jgi:excinuclease ABC subunit A
MSQRPPEVGAPARIIRVEGARQNNLRNIDLTLPRGALTVVTGVSGSGKSSLAMDTLYAEGQRRYLEGVSAHARRFLERLPRPDVDRVEGLSPAVSLGQRSGVRSARSTVGTSTEIHDYLRLLFARAGRVVCDRCGVEVPRWTVESVVDAWSGETVDGRRLLISFPYPLGKSDRRAVRRALRARGYLRAVVAEEAVDLAEAPDEATEWDVVQDRVREGRRGRLAEALGTAFTQGGGRAAVHPEGEPAARYRLGRVCATCGERYPDPHPLHFSFNSPAGACPTCQGFGYTLEFDPERIVPDPGRTLEEGAILPWAGRWRNWALKKLAASPRARSIPRDVPYADLNAEDRRFLFEGDRTFPGVMRFLERLSRKGYKAGARFLVKRYQSPRLCPDCGGSRLRAEGRRVRVGGLSLPEWSELPVADLGGLLDRLELTPRERDTVHSLLADLSHRLEVLDRVGLGYLTLSRLTRTLSGGEAQRIELAQALGASLVDALYVLDEPTVGLHPRDTGRLLEVLRDLTRQGNTVVVVEHDREVMTASDWLVDLGPGAGADGGDVVYCGPSDRRVEADWSPTVDVLRETPPERRPPLRTARGWLRLRGASLHNLKGIDVDLPWGVLVGVCGVSGSGKSSLVAETLVPLLEQVLAEGGNAGGRVSAREGLGRLKIEAPVAGVRVVDQDPLSRSARSIPASYVGAWNGIRSLFAALPESKRRGFTPGTFSFNVAGGRCEVCRGEGEVTVDMDFMPDVRLPCEACGGARFGPEALVPRYRGHSIVDVLALTADRALSLFAAVPSVGRPLWWMQRVGLGYLTLGQAAPTLSGGEAQRLKLTRELAGGTTGRLIVLDEPTVGLHGTEVARLVGLLRDMVRGGNTVLVVEHHLDVLAACDWLVELGPEGGEGGGGLVAAGSPEAVVREAGSRIAPFLGPLVAGGREEEAPPRRGRRPGSGGGG